MSMSILKVTLAIPYIGFIPRLYSFQNSEFKNVIFKCNDRYRSTALEILLFVSIFFITFQILIGSLACILLQFPLLFQLRYL